MVRPKGVHMLALGHAVLACVVSASNAGYQAEGYSKRWDTAS